jgi:hypothetical protein
MSRPTNHASATANCSTFMKLRYSARVKRACPKCGGTGYVRREIRARSIITGETALLRNAPVRCNSCVNDWPNEPRSARSVSDLAGPNCSASNNEREGK